jgi:hypothetical protein
VYGPLHGVSFVKGAVIEDEQIEGLGKCLGKVVKPELEEGGIQPRQFEKAAGAGGRFDGSIEIKIVERVRDGGDGLHAAGGDAPPDNRQHAPAAFILGNHCDRGAVGTGRTLLMEHRRERRLERDHGFRTFFTCDERGRLGLARSFPRTTA